MSNLRIGVMKNRRNQVILGFLLFLFGSWLLYDAYDRQGRKMKWPLGGIMPF